MFGKIRNLNKQNPTIDGSEIEQTSSFKSLGLM